MTTERIVTWTSSAMKTPDAVVAADACPSSANAPSGPSPATARTSVQSSGDRSCASSTTTAIAADPSAFQCAAAESGSFSHVSLDQLSRGAPF